MTTTQTTFDSASPDGATLDRATFDGAKAEAFGGRMMSILTGSLLNSMVDIGHRTGLFTAAAESPATSEQLAARAGLCERYVREWLCAVTTGGIVEYDQPTGFWQSDIQPHSDRGRPGRQPDRVVDTSGTGCLCVRRPVGKLRLPARRCVTV